MTKYKHLRMLKLFFETFDIDKWLITQQRLVVMFFFQENYSLKQKKIEKFNFGEFLQINFCFHHKEWWSLSEQIILVFI